MYIKTQKQIYLQCHYKYFNLFNVYTKPESCLGCALWCVIFKKIEISAACEVFGSLCLTQQQKIFKKLLNLP